MSAFLPPLSSDQAGPARISSREGLSYALPDQVPGTLLGNPGAEVQREAKEGRSPEDASQKITEVAAALLHAVGEEPSREGLLRTPARYAKAMLELTQGYHQSPKEVIGEGVFQAESPGLVAVKDVEFHSLCEHHLLPFWGKASVAYFPNAKILGLSKIPRLVDLFARRFQVQERLTQQIADAVKELISPRAVFVRVEACHLCMMMRGVKKQESHTRTEAWAGVESLSPLERDRILASLD